MIYSLRGRITHLENNLAVIECAGVGYACRTTSYTLSSLKEGDDAFLLTYMSIREDAAELFGFSEAAELRCFRMLISVNGVGPKAALSILSELSPQGFALCVAGGDSKLLTRAPGIGKKTADRIILELKDKMNRDFGDISAETYSALSAAPAVTGGTASEALSALMVLGFDRGTAAKALEGFTEDMTVSEMVKEALKRLGSR